jgi:ADP-heptose:LPS heptosyltransferase
MDLIPKILVIRQLALGDVLLATPIIEQLYKDYQGNCAIDVLTLKPEVFTNNPYVHKTYTPQTYQEINFLYDKTINLDLAYEKQPLLHITDAYALYAFGSPEKLQNKRIQLFSSPQDKLKANWIAQAQIQSDYAIIHMRQDTWPSRNLSEQTWKSIVDLLLQETQLKIVQIGSEREFAFDHDPRLINMLGKVNIHELKELIAGSKLFLGIDSGTLHIAATTDCPIICMFTSAHHTLRMPLGRKSTTKFTAIAPKIECYGCQAHFPPPITGVICHKGDPFSPPCRDLFDLEDMRRAIRDMQASA